MYSVLSMIPPQIKYQSYSVEWSNDKGTSWWRHTSVVPPTTKYYFRFECGQQSLHFRLQRNWDNMMADWKSLQYKIYKSKPHFVFNLHVNSKTVGKSIQNKCAMKIKATLSCSLRVNSNTRRIARIIASSPHSVHALMPYTSFCDFLSYIAFSEKNHIFISTIAFLYDKSC